MKHGYSIIEVLLAGVIFALAASGVSAAIMFAQRSGQASAQQAEATKLAEEAVSALNIIRTRDFDELIVGNNMALQIDQGQWVLNPNPTDEDDFHEGKRRRISITQDDGVKTADIIVTFTIGASGAQGQVSFQETYANLGQESIVGVTSASQNLQLSDEGLDTYEVDLSPTSSTVLGEAGRFTAASGPSDVWNTISFSRSYNIIPIVIGTANSEDEDNPANVFEVRNVTENSAEMRLCNSRITPGICDPHSVDQIGAYMIIDLERVGQVDGIAAGRINVVGGGNTSWTTASFGATFTSAPLVFSTAQNIPGNFPLDTKVRNVTTTTVQLQLCHMATSDNCASFYPTTPVGWVAIDPTSLSLQQQFFGGTVTNVPNSEWRPVSFAYPEAQFPILLVENQTKTGGQSGEINSARNITNLSAEVGYCELDAGGLGGVGVCDVHQAENIAWFALRPGLITYNAGL